MGARKQKRPALPTPLEREEARWADRAAEMMGYEVKRLEQRRASKIAEGLPDRIYGHRGRGVLVWAELKSETGKPSAKQKDFHQFLRDCGQHVVCGTANVIGEYLMSALRQSAGSGDDKAMCEETPHQKSAPTVPLSTAERLTEKREG